MFVGLQANCSKINQPILLTGSDWLYQRNPLVGNDSVRRPTFTRNLNWWVRNEAIITGVSGDLDWWIGDKAAIAAVARDLITQIGDETTVAPITRNLDRRIRNGAICTALTCDHIPWIRNERTITFTRNLDRWIRNRAIYTALTCDHIPWIWNETISAGVACLRNKVHSQYQPKTQQ